MINGAFIPDNGFNAPLMVLNGVIETVINGLLTVISGEPGSDNVFNEPPMVINGAKIFVRNRN